MNSNSIEVIPLDTRINASSNMPLTEEELVAEKGFYMYCKAASLQVGQAHAEFRLDDSNLMIQKSIVDDAIQIIVPHSIRNQMVYISYFPSKERHPSQHINLGRTTTFLLSDQYGKRVLFNGLQFRKLRSKQKSIWT